MNFEKIIISSDETHHLYNNKPIYIKRFKKVMSYHEPGLAAVEDENGAYHIDIIGAPVYKERFEKSFGFYYNRAAVFDNSGWYHIKPDGKSICDERYCWVGNFQEERCTVRDKDGGYFHIDLDGTRIYDEKYSYAGDFKYKIAVVYDKEGYAHHIDQHGNQIHEKRYQELGVYHKGFAIARDANGFFHIDKKGDPLYKQRYQWIEPFYNGYALIKKDNSNLCIIDESGNEVHSILDDTAINIKKIQRNRLMGMLVGYWETQILKAIVKSKILDRIKEGSDTKEKISTVLDMPSSSINMILEVLGLWGFITEKDDRIKINYLGDLLTQNHPDTLKYAALMWGGEHYQVMSRLYESLKKHAPVFEEMYGKEVFNYYNSNRKEGYIYNQAMKEYSTDYDLIISKYDFPDAKIIMDVGGGKGHLLEQIMINNPHIEKGIIFDLPSVIEQAKISLENSDVGKKIEYIKGNFFKGISVRTDVVCITRILHDWNDKKAIEILTKIHSSLNDNGRLLIFEMIVPDNPIIDMGITLNFNLLAMTGGKERTLNEFKSILFASGFKIIDIIEGDKIISMLIAEKVNG